MSAHCFSKKKDTKLLLLDIKEKINLQLVNIIFYTLMNYFSKLCKIF